MSKSASFENRDKFIQIGVTIATLRRLQGINQKTLANIVGVSRSTISVIESSNKIRSFSLETFLKISYALSVEPEDLINASVIPDNLLGIKNRS